MAALFRNNGFAKINPHPLLAAKGDPKIALIDDRSRSL
jgi:hypothetical protein